MGFVTGQPETMRVDPMLESQLRKPPSKQDSESRIKEIKRQMLKMLEAAKKLSGCREITNQALSKWNDSTTRLKAAEEEQWAQNHLPDFACGVESLSDALTRENTAKEKLKECRAEFANFKSLYIELLTKQLPAIQEAFSRYYWQLRKIAHEEFQSSFNFSESFRRAESVEKFVERKALQQTKFLSLLEKCGHPDVCAVAIPQLIDFLEAL